MVSDGVHPAGTPLTCDFSPGRAKVTLFVSWLTCSLCVTVSRLLKSIPLGNVKALVGGLLAESSWIGFLLFAYVLPAIAKTARLLSTGRVREYCGTFEAMLLDCEETGRGAGYVVDSKRKLWSTCAWMELIWPGMGVEIYITSRVEAEVRDPSRVSS